MGLVTSFQAFTCITSVIVLILQVQCFQRSVFCWKNVYSTHIYWQWRPAILALTQVRNFRGRRNGGRVRLWSWGVIKRERTRRQLRWRWTRRCLRIKWLRFMNQVCCLRSCFYSNQYRSWKNDLLPSFSTTFCHRFDLRAFSVVYTNFQTFQLTNRMWFSVVCTLIDNDTHHHSGQNVVDSRRVSPQQILTTVLTRIVVDKSTYHAKPHSICFLPQYQR